jgi:hypothetical protein
VTTVKTVVGVGNEKTTFQYVKSGSVKNKIFFKSKKPQLKSVRAVFFKENFVPYSVHDYTYS